MDSDRYQKINRIFLQVCDLPPKERETALTRACQGDSDLVEEVRSLLEGDASPSPDLDVEESPSPPGARLLGEVVEGRRQPSSPLKTIAGYTITRRLGEGGMGTVYEATQETPHRTVALKVVRDGLTNPELLRRFKREAELLGRLSDPGIAHVYEAGIEESTEEDGSVRRQPFFAMEYIDGVRLDEHARRHELSSEQRLELIARIGDAVQHAHDKGVIHRDLKPANILVDQTGHPKILDFGVARASSVSRNATFLETAAGEMLGTLPYMSPEQVAGRPEDLDERTDVYSLGVLLFELLSGRRPHSLEDCSLPEGIRRVAESEPPLLGSLCRDHRGELETIVDKALSKDRDQRYSSAAALAADLRRFLRREPIHARPPTTVYQLRKFAQRNRILVSSLVTVFLVTLAALIVSIGMYLRAEDSRQKEARQKRAAVDAQIDAERSQAAEALQRELAEDRRREALAQAALARSANDFLVEMLGVANPTTSPRGREMTAWQMVDDAARRIAPSYSSRPEIEAVVKLTIGRAYEAQGRFAEGEPLLRRALELRSEFLKENDPQLLEAEFLLGTLLGNLGKLQEGESLCRKTHENARAHLEPEDPLIAQTGNGLAEILLFQSRYSDSETLLVEVIDRVVASSGENSADLPPLLGTLGAALWFQGRYGEAEPVFRRGLGILRRLHPSADHPHLAETMTNLAVLLRTLGRLDEAGPLYEEALEIAQRAYGEVHPTVATTLNNIGKLKEAQKDFTAAEKYMTEALTMRIEIYGERHAEVAALLHNLGYLMKNQGQYRRAKEFFLKALSQRRELLGVHSSVSDSLNALGRLHENLRDLSQAEHYLRQSLAIDREIYGESRFLAGTLGDLGRVLCAEKKYAESEAILQEAVDMTRKIGGDRHQSFLRRLANLETSLLEQGKVKDAEPILRERVEVAKELLGEDHRETTKARRKLEQLREGLQNESE